MMKIAGWAGRRCSGVGRIVPSKWTLRPLLVALTPFPDLFDPAKDLFVEAKPPGLGQCAARKDLLSGHLSLVAGPSVEAVGQPAVEL
jgi:hypothetical protein